MLKLGLVALLVLVIAGLAYIRLAPSDPTRWHFAQPQRLPGDYPANAGFEARRLVSDPQIMTALHRVALLTPRTSLLAGSPESGLTTYVTRSRLMGYPDYTTVQLDSDGPAGLTLAIYGRARFGSSDMGVNRARISAWLADLGLPGA